MVHPHAAGIDIGATEHFVAVPPDAVPADGQAVKSFKTFSQDLDALVEWLKACGVDTVAMESTGVHWIPAFQKIEEAGLEVILVNAHSLKHVPGRTKTDVHDCQWIQRLHACGLLRGSFRPPQEFIALRSLSRHRQTLIASAAEHTQRMQKALTEMNVPIHHVLNDITGETGLRLLKAILKGERDPDKLLLLRDAQITKSTPEEMRKALVGDWRPEQLFILEQELGAWEFAQKQIRECTLKIEEQLDRLPSAPKREAPPTPKPDPLAATHPKPKAKQSRKRNEPERDWTAQLARILGVDLTKAHGLRVLTVLTILSELGPTLEAFPTPKAFSSWLGLCPNNKISGGRVLSTRSRKVANRVATALRMAASGVAETDTWLGVFHRRMRSRLGPPAAITATAHKIAIVVYHLIKNQEAFVDRDLAAYQERVQKASVERLKKTASRMGFKLVPKNQPPQEIEQQTLSE